MVVVFIARVCAPTAMLVTSPLLLPSPEFWYQAMPNASGTVSTFHPFETMSGYSFMNTPTVL